MGRLKCVFRVPSKLERYVFGENGKPTHLAYVELFTKTVGSVAPSHHGYYVVKPDYYGADKKGPRMGVVVSVEQIYRGCQLLPEFRGPVNRSWNPHNVLDNADAFFINSHRDLESFQTIY